MPKKTVAKKTAIKKKTAVKKGSKGKPGSRRLTAEQKNEAIQICIRLLSEMEHPSDIVQIIAKKYRLGSRMPYNFLAEARKKMQEQVETEFNSCLTNAIVRLKVLRRKVDQEGDRRTQLGVEREINRLLLPAKLEISGSGGGPIVTRDETPRVEITPEALFEAVDILRKAEKKNGSGEE